MKKILIVFLLFLVSCSKEELPPSIPITFSYFEYCYLGDQFRFSFVVEENTTVKNYSLYGSSNNTKYTKISEVISEKTNGLKKYDVIMSRKVPPYYFRVNVVYNNGLVETSNTIAIE